MTYVIALPCVDVKDKACIDECPVDCIYEGERMLYIHPDECVDCGACEPVCPVGHLLRGRHPRGVGRVLQGQRRVLRRPGLPGRRRQAGHDRQGPPDHLRPAPAERGRLSPHADAAGLPVGHAHPLP